MANDPTKTDESQPAAAALRQFVSMHKAKPQCWACKLPAELLAAVNAERKLGTPVTVIKQFLEVVKGYPRAEVERLRNHFAARHHDEQP